MSIPRIVHVVNSVEHGGAERVVLDLATAQHDIIGECEVICLHAKGELEPEFTSRGIPVVQLPSSTHGALRTAWQLAGLLQHRPPRVVHAHNVAPQLAVALGRRLRWWGNDTTRLVYTQHGRLTDHRRHILLLRRWLGQDYHCVVGVSEDVRDQLLVFGIGSPGRTHVIKNGVDLTRFVMSPSRVVDQVRRIVAVGRLSEIKGQDVLLEALAIAKASIGPLVVTLVGDGPTRGALEEQSRRLDLVEMVRFAGAQRDIRPFLDSASLFVLPSRSEGISLALLEAMACGIPVVATGVGGTPEVTGPDRGGILVPPEDPASMAAAMVRMLLDPALAAREGRAARERVVAEFSLQRNVFAYQAIYGLSKAT